MNDCLQSTLIKRFIASECTADERRTVDGHLAVCAACGERVREAHDIDQIRKHMQEEGMSRLRADELIGDPAGPLSKGPRRSVLTDAPTPSIPGYRILGEIHRGGQGVVYKALQEGTQQKVAVKVILEGPHASDRSRQLFHIEVQLLGRLRHPSIVRIYDSRINEGLYFFAMEYVRGEPLDSHVRAKNLALREKMVLFSKICGGVAYAHLNAVIHCDLKPGNILVTRDGDPRILDFGLAKVAGPRQPGVVLSITGQLIGTLSYMAPEQAAGESHAVDVRTDVYTLGVILFEMLTGAFPYDVQGSRSQVLRTIQEADPKRPSRLAREVDSEIEAILFKALEKEPARRYQSASELHHDIDCWLTGLPIVAKSVSLLYLFRKLLARHRYAASVLGLVTVILLAYGSISLRALGQARGAAQRLERVNETIRELRSDLGDPGKAAMARERRLAFVWFLLAWHQHRIGEARAIMQRLALDTPERFAASFLLDPEPLDEKLPDLKAKLGNAKARFSEFVVGEYFLQKGNRAAARDAYGSIVASAQGTSSQPATAHGWLVDRAMARLNSLADDGTPATPLRSKDTNDDE